MKQAEARFPAAPREAQAKNGSFPSEGCTNPAEAVRKQGLTTPQTPQRACARMRRARACSTNRAKQIEMRKGTNMEYRYKAHPTTYRGTRFRSRLEARWAAYFDLCGIQWEYEPFDLEGWVPDFLLKHENHEVLVEVKPVADPNDEINAYAKATAHNTEAWVMLLGRKPDLILCGVIFDHPKMWELASIESDPWSDFHERISPANTLHLWAEADNKTRWLA